MSAEEKKPETAPDDQSAAAASGSPEHAAAETAPGGEPAEAAVATAESAPAEAEKGKEQPPVRYELLEATPRAGAIVDLKIKVLHEEYDRKTQDFYKELRQTVIIEGFRRGKAPLKLIQNRYHKEVKQDALDFLLGNCLEQIVKEKNYQVLREFDRVDPEVAEGQELVFALSLEVRPQIEPHGYEAFDLTVDTHQVDDALVEAEVEKLRQRHATFQSAELLAYTPGHGVTLDIHVTDDKGNEIKELTREDLFFAYPERSLPEPVAQQLRGQRAGDLFVANVPNERKTEGGVITSQHDVYHVKVREVKRQILPELNDEFAQDVGGLKTIQELRDHIRKEFEHREESGAREQALEKIYDQLMERNLFDVPKAMVDEMYVRLVREHAERLRLLGLSLEDLGDDPKEYVLRTERNAERMNRVVLLNEAIAQKEKLVPTDEDVERAIAKLAEEEGRRPLAIRARLEAQKRLDQFREDLKYDLVNNLLLSRARIVKQYVAMESKIVTRDNA